MVIITGMVPMMPMGSAETQVDVESVAPVVNADNVTVCDDPAGVNAENWINFTIEDGNSMDDIKNITVELFYANSTDNPYKPSAESNRSYYVFKWNESGGDAWHCALNDSYVNISGHSGPYEPGGSEGWQFVNLSFKLNETAVPSGDVTQWNVSVTVYDLDGNTNNALNATSLNVSEYVSAEQQEAGVDFGPRAPGDPTSTETTTISFTSNTQVEINVTGANLVCGSNNIGYANFLYNATDVGEEGENTATVFTGSAQTAYAEYNATEDTLNTAITGWNYEVTPALEFNGTIPSPQPAGTYSGTWNIDFTTTTAA